MLAAAGGWSWQASAFPVNARICGNYCGPNWCNAQVLDEAKCDDSVPVETHSVTGPSCADSCCKMHDKCCGHGERSTCNKAIVDCLGKCDKIGSRLGSAGDHWLDLGESGACICAGTILQGGNAERFAQDTLKSLSRCPAFSSLNSSSQSPICSLSIKIWGTV